MIWCSADGLREGVVLDVGVVMVESQPSFTEQTGACFGCDGAHGNHR